MPASKAQQRAVNKYVKENYDLFQIKMPKGRKAEIQTAAAAAGESLNAYINASIAKRMGRDTSGEALGEPVDDLTTTIQLVPPGTLAAAEAAAKAAKERTGDFIAHAIRDAIEAPTAPTEAGAVSLPPDTIKTATEAAEASGEALPVFVGRAIEETAERDTLPKEVIFGRAVDVLAEHYEVSPWDVLDELKGLKDKEQTIEGGEHHD